MLSSTSAKLPPENYRRIIQEMLVVLPDPVDKLNLLNRVLVDYRRIPSSYRLYPRWAEIALRKMVLEEAERIQPGSRKKAHQLIKQGVITIPKPFLWKVYRFRHVIVSTLVLLFVWGMGSAVAAFFNFIQPEAVINTTIAGPKRIKVPPPPTAKNESVSENQKPGETAIVGTISTLTRAQVKETTAIPANENHKPTGIIAFYLEKPKREFCSIPSDIPITIKNRKALKAFSDKAALTIVSDQKVKASPSTSGAAEVTTVKTLSAEKSETVVAVPEYLEKPIWLVDKTGNIEVYSNRLHIITTHTVDNIPRKYIDFPRSAKNGEKKFNTAGQISGILYHASESDIFPFNPEMSASIKKHSAALIRYLKRKKSYHYFIDRFGRVYRIVRGDHAAFHAGRSIWADEDSFYLNLNHAFIGICFEGRDFETVKPDPAKSKTRASGPRLVAMEKITISDAQLRSGKELTDWLRVKYRIQEHNCVPHGLVSINPRRKLIGHHLDLSHSFPFQRFGLSDKYQHVLPSIVDFGFTYDSFFLQIFKGKPWPGVNNSMVVLEKRAKEKKVNLTVYQKRLQKKFDSYHAMEEKLQVQEELLAKKNGKKTYSKTAKKE